MTFTILFVGSTNVGRSVLAAAQTDRALKRVWPRAADDVDVVSAGVDAIDGMPCPSHLETVAGRRGIEVGDHRAAHLDRETVERADLVLTMTRRERAQVVLQYPAARPRTFVLVEFFQLLDAAASVDRRTPLGRGERLDARLRRVVTAALQRRRSDGPSLDEQQVDLFDPYAYSLDVYESVAQTVEDLIERLVADVARMTGAASQVRSA